MELNKYSPPASWEEAYRLYYRHMFRVARRITSNTADAQDLTHDVFMHIRTRMQYFRGDATFGSWLHRITVRLVLMYFRKKSTRTELLTDDGNIGYTAEKRQNSNAPLFVETLDLMRAVKQLPVRMGRVFILHDVEGRTHDEIGRIMGIDPGTSKSQLFKARKHIRHMLYG